MESHSKEKEKKRHKITTCEKRRKCQYKIKNRKTSLDMMVKHYGSGFGHNTGKSTIEGILIKIKMYNIYTFFF